MVASNEDKYDCSQIQKQGSEIADKRSWIFFLGSVYFFMLHLFSAIAVFPAYSLHLGSTSFQAGLQSTAFLVAAIIIRLVLGPSMDRMGPKPLMLAGIFSFASSPLLLVFSQSYEALLIMRIYQAFGLAVVMPGISTLVSAMAPAGRTNTYLGATRIFFNLALLTGPSLSFFLIAEIGYRGWLLMLVLTASLSLAMLTPVENRQINLLNRTQKSVFWHELKGVFSQKRIFPLISAIALHAFAYSAILSFSAIHMSNSKLTVDTSLFFLILGSAGIFSCLCTGLIADRFGRNRIAWPLLFLLGSGSILFSISPGSSVLVLASALIFGFTIQGSSLLFTAWLIDISSSENRATTFSLQENIIDICFAFGAMLFGAAAGSIGLNGAFLSMGLIFAASVPLLKMWEYALRNNTS